jgi:hypothetical protein
MKKSILLFGILLLTVSMAFSQAAFYTQDFGSGIPAGWTNAGTDASGQAHTNMWKYTHTGNHSAIGWPTVALNSPTAANGWIIFDSDSLDDSQAGGTLAPQRGYLTTTPISCTGHSNVLLQFYQFYYSAFGVTRVVVSNGTASDTIEVNPTYDFLFGVTTNGGMKQYDITNIASNQAAVTITFLWDNGEYYYWQVDDISLLDAPANDIKISRAGSFDYYSYPLSQINNAGTISYYSRVTNIGADTAYNVRATINITKGGTTYFSDTTPLGTNLAPEIDSPVVGINSWSPTNAPTGNYTSIVRVFSDSTDALLFDNGDTSKFAINDSIYAIDNGTYGGSFPIYDAANTSSPVNEWVNVFQVVAQDTLTSIIAAFDPLFSNFSGTAGPVVQGHVYSLDTATLAATQILTTETKTLTTTNFPSLAQNVPTGYTYTPKPVVFKINVGSGSPVLAPGLYAISIVNISTDSTVYLTNSFSKVYGQLSGDFVGGQPDAFYNNTQFYLRMAFGHGLNLLTCDWVRTPGTSPVRTNTNVLFSARTNASINATYRWDITGVNTGAAYPSLTGKQPTYAFPVADSFLVCLTVTDGSDSLQACHYVRVTDNAGINELSSLSDVSLVPNPTTGLVTISVSGATGPLSISITNLVGEEVKQYNEQANGSFEKSYNLSDLAAGVYIVKLQNADGMTSKRLSISK